MDFITACCLRGAFSCGLTEYRLVQAQHDSWEHFFGGEPPVDPSQVGVFIPAPIWKFSCGSAAQRAARIRVESHVVRDGGGWRVAGRKTGHHAPYPRQDLFVD